MLNAALYRLFDVRIWCLPCARRASEFGGNMKPLGFPSNIFAGVLRIVDKNG